ncbi:hypothetical protein GCM10028803_24020 [Larkinella knui]|uniref:hypothetical protein n=1 Tax=Larkinella knui TaxID=2025310 RepID=UPI00163B10C7|nr:hypothetical protein [Larkinella knui]
MADARNGSMIEDQEGQVKAVTYDFVQFDYAMNIGFNPMNKVGDGLELEECFR